MTTLRLVGRLHAKAVFGRRTRVLADTLGPLLPPGRILDVGCGDGSIDALIMRRRPGVSIEGVDIMARRGAAIPVSEFDGSAIPFGPDAFDAVLLVDVLHHTADPAALLAECARVSRGPVLIKDHVARNGCDRAILGFMDWVGNRPHGVVLLYHFLDLAEWARVFRIAGLSAVGSVDHLPLYPFPFSLLFGRGLHRVFSLRKLQTREPLGIAMPQEEHAGALACAGTPPGFSGSSTPS